MRGERGKCGGAGAAAPAITSAIDDHVFLSRSYQLADITGHLGGPMGELDSFPYLWVSK